MCECMYVYMYSRTNAHVWKLTLACFVLSNMHTLVGACIHVRNVLIYNMCTWMFIHVDVWIQSYVPVNGRMRCNSSRGTEDGWKVWCQSRLYTDSTVCVRREQCSPTWMLVICRLLIAFYSREFFFFLFARHTSDRLDLSEGRWGRQTDRHTYREKEREKCLSVIDWMVLVLLSLRLHHMSMQSFCFLFWSCFRTAHGSDGSLCYACLRTG